MTTQSPNIQYGPTKKLRTAVTAVAVAVCDNNWYYHPWYQLISLPRRVRCIFFRLCSCNPFWNHWNITAPNGFTSPMNTHSLSCDATQNSLIFNRTDNKNQSVSYVLLTSGHSNNVLSLFIAL